MIETIFKESLYEVIQSDPIARSIKRSVLFSKNFITLPSNAMAQSGDGIRKIILSETQTDLSWNTKGYNFHPTSY